MKTQSKNPQALDLTGAYYLRLEAPGLKPETIRVSSSEIAIHLFNDFRDGYNLGASEMGRDCGKVTDTNGAPVCTITYNGRVRLPNGEFLDGMNGREWLDFCAVGKTPDAAGRFDARLL